jgi:4-diphosphocytidyl-2-C-methyl-D-erythritol kinase
VLNKDKRVDIDRLIRYLEEGNLKGLAENMVNVMEEVVVKDHPIISEIKKDMMKYGALGALMSGSGPTVFGIFDDEEKMIYCKNKLSNKIKKIYMCKTI